MSKILLSKWTSMVVTSLIEVHLLNLGLLRVLNGSGIFLDDWVSIVIDDVLGSEVDDNLF